MIFDLNHVHHSYSELSRPRKVVQAVSVRCYAARAYIVSGEGPGEAFEHLLESGVQTEGGRGERGV